MSVLTYNKIFVLIVQKIYCYSCCEAEKVKVLNLSVITIENFCKIFDEAKLLNISIIEKKRN